MPVFPVTEHNTETKVDFVQLITSGELMFQAPAGLAAGIYTLDPSFGVRFGSSGKPGG